MIRGFGYLVHLTWGLSLICFDCLFGLDLVLLLDDSI